MKFTLLKAAVLFSLLYISPVSARSQPYHQLTMDDFGGAPQPHDGVIAYTNCTIDFRYTAERVSGFYRLNFDIRLIMNRERSWLDRSRITSQDLLNEILKHEQGHYTIAYLEQQEVLRQVSKTRFSDDYQQEAKRIFNRVDAKYKQLNIDYDEDTGHMTNHVQQQSWDKYFFKRLEYMPPA